MSIPLQSLTGVDVRVDGGMPVSLPPTFEPYHKDVLKSGVRTLWIDGWKIEFLAFSSPVARPPIVIIGGAFQNFNSYKYCVEPLLAAGPLILVDLPAMGANDQTVNTVTHTSSMDLNLDQLSELLYRWLNEIDVKYVSLMGMSLGSVVAATFSARYPSYVHRQVLMGIMKQTRHSWRMLLEQSLELLDNRDMETFSQGVVLYLVNHTRLEQTRISPTAKRLFCTQMASFTENERERYHINANRLLNITTIASPACPTLVATGEYDSFTLPFENAFYASTLPNAEFALIEGADHLPQLEKRRETVELFTRYLSEGDIHSVAGIKVLSPDQLLTFERRRQPRITPSVTSCNLQLGDIIYSAHILELNYFGLRLQMSDSQSAHLIMQHPTSFTIDFKLAGQTFRLGLMCIEQQDNDIRALFKHTSFEISGELTQCLQSLQP